MEFLIGRSLTNNITNLMLRPFVERAAREGSLDWFGLVDQEPDAGLGNGGLGRLAACFLDSMATMQLPAMGYGLRYEYGMFRQSIDNGWQREHPDNWLRRQDPWEVARRHEAVEVKFGCTFEMHQGSLRVVPGRPSALIGMPFDRPVVGFGGKTINSLRLWSAAAHDYFDFQRVQHGRLRGRPGRQHRGADADPRPLPGRFHRGGTGAALCTGILPGRLLAGRSGAPLSSQQHGLEPASRQGRHPAQ